MLARDVEGVQEGSGLLGLKLGTRMSNVRVQEWFWQAGSKVSGDLLQAAKPDESTI